MCVWKRKELFFLGVLSPGLIWVFPLSRFMALRRQQGREMKQL